MIVVVKVGPAAANTCASWPARQVTYGIGSGVTLSSAAVGRAPSTHTPEV